MAESRSVPASSSLRDDHLSTTAAYSSMGLPPFTLDSLRTLSCKVRRRLRELSRPDRATRNALGFGATMMASACLNNLFVTYYMEMFTEVARVSSTWFYCGQLVFMAWNSTNDLLFGWLSDKRWGKGEGAAQGAGQRERRLFAIRYGGIGWILSFLCVWWTPGPAHPHLTGLYCAFVLCLYDGMLTYVEVNHSALLADMTTSEAERARANMYSAAFAAVGSASLVFSHTFWDPANLARFRTYCLAVAAVSFGAFSWTAGTMESGQVAKGGDGLVGGGERRAEDEEEGAAQLSLVGFLQQVFSHRNFQIFSSMSFLQVFDCTFEKNFFSMFLAHFAGASLPPSQQSLVISLSVVLPWACTILATPLVQSSGVYRTLQGLLVVRVGIAFLGFVEAVGAGRTSWAYLLVNRVTSECVCRLMPLVISDLVDEDIHIHRRKTSLSASVVGLSGVMGKMSQSLAPMLGYALFSLSSEDGLEGPATARHVISPPLVIALVPLTVVFLQLGVWARFTLHGSYLKKVKKSVNRMQRPAMFL